MAGEILPWFLVMRPSGNEFQTLGRRTRQPGVWFPFLRPLCSCELFAASSKTLGGFFLYSSDAFRRVKGVALGEGCLHFESNIGVII